jgi:hypothetical protein
MSFDFTGHVLRAPRVAPGNAATSSEPQNGVVRDVRLTEGTRTAAQPDIADLSGDQYRSAVLEGPGTSPHEYLVWAAFSGQLARIENADWWTEEGSGRIPLGEEETYQQVIINDDGGRQLGLVLAVVVARGDVEHDDDGWVDATNPLLGRLGTEPYKVIIPLVADFNPTSGVVTLTDDNVYEAPDTGLVAGTVASVFDGGLSVNRGDVVEEVRYTLAAVKFWWTRNDRYETRFGWNDTLQRWMPYKGSAPVSLGRLLFDETYKLSPLPSNLPVGAVLPGNALVGDGYAMVRLGSSPGATSTPVGVSDPNGFTGIYVVSDSVAEGYDFSGSVRSGVVGQTNGVLKFNPRYIEDHAGKTIWYVYQGFPAEADGLVGSIDDDLFLAPVPGPTDHPFIRINNRSSLAVELVATDADALAAAPVEGSCVVALTTGRLVLSQTDLAKAEPSSVSFNKHFLGANIYYEGVALNATPQSVKGPQALVQQDQVTTTMHPFEPMYLADSTVWPEDHAVADEGYRGLGLSGVLHMPDGTGAIPSPEGITPTDAMVSVRPGGDSLVGPPQSIGLIRQVHDGVGDTILFSKGGAVTEIVVVARNSDVPDQPHEVPSGVAYIAREATTLGGVRYSKVQFGTETRRQFVDEPVYFIQASINPATYTEQASIVSKSRIIFRFEGDETLYFAIDGTAHEWASSSLLAALPTNEFFTAGEVAASIQAKIVADGGTGVCRAAGDRLVLEEADPTTGQVEIGWGNPRDLSGAAVLGFLPGWLAEAGKPNWLSDAGISMGLSRSLLNLDQTEPVADYFAQYRLEDVILAQSVQASPFTFFDFPPVEDIAGYAEGVFFNIQTIAVQGDDIHIIDKRLGHYEEIEHRFAEGKFAWLDSTFVANPVLQPTATVNLGNPGVVPATLLGASGIGGAFMTAEDGGSFAQQEQDVDYLLPGDGQPGIAQLITRYGARVAFGGQGAYTEGGTTFTDPEGTFTSDLSEGDRLKLTSGDAAGSYIVQSITSDQAVEVLPPFTADAERAMPWEAFAGYPDSVYDPAIVADQIYKPFNHLAEEPFQIRVLSPLGDIEPTTVDFTAYVEDANASGRAVSLRFGPVHPAAGVTATLNPTTLLALGVVANNVLVLPATTHVAEGAFDILMSTELLVQGVDVLPVVAFSNDPVSVEYLTAAWDDGTTTHPAGELKFNSTLLVELGSSGVSVVETLRSSSNLAAGEAEYDPKTGALRISDADAATHDGKKLYFTEQMVTEEPGADVKVSPMIGGVSFRKPIKTGCLVEMEYWLADREGRRVGDPDDTIIEFLPVFVRREEATRLTDHEFSIDPLGAHVIDTRIEPVAHVGPKQQNFGRTDFTTDQPGVGMRLTFDRDLPTWATPQVSYAVFDALGGERAYTTSQHPVYRPPFFIKAGKDNFGMRGNRVADFEPGQMLRIGAECFYISKLRYFSDPDTTRVDIYPTTVNEVGSRSPGNDVLTLVTAGPITPEVVFENTTVATAAPQGFMQVLQGFEFEPVNAKQSSITFLGDLSIFAVPGHIMELGGHPFTIASSVLSEDGTRTKLTFTSPFRTAFVSSGTEVRLSYRPVYPPEVRQFVGVGPYVDTEDVELVLFGEDVGGVAQPGRTLALGTEYQIDSATGVVVLTEPLQDPLGPGQKLFLSHTKIRVMEPFFQRGSVQFPRWLARYKYNVIPSVANGYLDSTLTATYTFDNPDSFYYRALPMRSYLGEAVQQAVAEMKRGEPSNGPQLSVPAGADNWDKGNQGLLSQQRELLDKDRSARALLSFYNDAVVAFEQVDECLTGKYIGDRDGKFRYWIGRGLEYTPPGYEDPITGELNASNVWSRVFNEGDTSRDITFLVDGDPLVKPESATITDLQLAGAPLGAARLTKMMDRQRVLVRNDVDDILLLAASTPRVIPSNDPPYFTVESGGVFTRMGTAHRYSRIFPTSARVLFTLMPGIGADLANGDVGTYSWSTVNPDTGEAESTHGEQIGQVGNPVLGDITSVSESLIRLRLPRTRIVGYYPSGLPLGAFFAGSAPITKPCCVVSQVPLSELPIDPATGQPDVSRFLSVDPAGDTPDAVAGDPLMALPGFQAGQKIGWAKPDGRFLAAMFPEELDIFGTRTFTSVFVDEVLHGCVLTFKNRHDEAITSPYDLLVGTTSNSGIPAHIFGIGRADTIYVLPPDVANPITDPATESPTMAVMQQAALLTPVLRQGTDITVDTSGRVLDLSLPSWADPFIFPIKELSGQKTPTPLSHLGGEVDFANIDQLPLNVPALLGQPLDDSGDVALPYMKGTNSELDRFDEITNVIGPLMAVVPSGGGAYPDEFLTNLGELLPVADLLAGSDYKEPSTLMLPVKTDPAGTYGVAPAQEGDLVLLETDGAGLGWQGFLSVGRLRNKTVAGDDWSWVEPPRFVTQVNQGSQVQYELLNYATSIFGNYPPDPQVSNPPGARLFEDLVGGKHILSMQDLVGFTLNDGDVGGPGGIGNLNRIVAADPANIVRVKLLARPDVMAFWAENPLGVPTPFLPPEQDGRVLLTIEVRQVDMRVTDFHGHSAGWVPHGGVAFGDFDPVTLEPAPATAPEMRHIIFRLPPPNSFRLTPIFPAVPADWYLPHMDTGTLKSSLYGYDLAIDVDTLAGFSDTAYIDSDRLTFHEVIDFTWARPRLYTVPLAPFHVYQTSLQVTGIETPAGVGNPVNDVAGVGLTLLARDGSLTEAGGDWNAAPTPAEEGSIRVMAFEEANTAPALTTGITASVVASQAEHADGDPICEGVGEAQENRIGNAVIAPNFGGIDRVEKGDLVYIDQADAARTATEKAGTYIVRHAVVPDAAVDYKAVSVSSFLGSGGFISTAFPRILGIDFAGNLLEIDDHSMLPATGKVYVLMDESVLNSATNLVEYRPALFSVEYTGFNLIGLNPRLITDPLTFRWAENTLIALPSVELDTTKIVGKRLGWHDNSGPGTGLTTLQASVRGGELPDDSSVVGFSSGGVATLGFADLTYEATYGVTSVLPASIITGAPPVAGEVEVGQAAAWLNNTFDANDEVPVYPGVPAELVLHVSEAQGVALYDPNGLTGPTQRITCLLPGAEVRTEDAAGNPGFFAQSGVFVEPSLPLYPVSLDPGPPPNVVDLTRSMLVGTVGMRSPSAPPEDVHFEVRRCRRWHGSQNAVNDAFHPLQYAYEIRRGRVTGFGRTPQQYGLLVASAFTMDWSTANAYAPDVWNDGKQYNGTNLGPFDSEDVNINPGDLLRLLDDDGNLLDEAVISEVRSGTTLMLEPPAFGNLTEAEVFQAVAGGRRFEIWLRQAPVPHEQSNEQLLDLITDRVVHETIADRSDVDPTNWVGGYVDEVVAAGDWTTIANKFGDDSTPAVSFVALGVRAGDIVVIDPAGTMPVVDEMGIAPLGDTSVPTRTSSGGAVPYVAGQVSSLDDNRGFYRVVTVAADELTVDPIHTFAGTLGGDVLMAETETDLVYAIYPTVSSSVLSDPAPNTGEGQNDLRPTRLAVGGTYTSVVAIEDKHSIRPFSYRIIRPNSMFGEELVDTVLMLRERMLSLIELFRSATKGLKGGYYWTWQDEEHVEDLGDPADPNSGLGLFPNRMITSLVGETSHSPFANTSDCLSLLDRRLWVLDRRLDSLKPDAANPFGMTEYSNPPDPVFPNVGGPYTAYSDLTTGGAQVRPVLPDHLGLILNVRDRLRGIRYTWLAYRTHRYIGTLAQIAAFNAALPGKLEERKRVALLEQTATEVPA